MIVEHEISVGNQRCLLEEQTIVYREPAKAGSQPIKAKAAPTEAKSTARAQTRGQAIMKAGWP